MSEHDDRGDVAEEPLHRKAITRERIVQAAMVLFGQRGFEHTTVTQIAKRAGVSRASIFWHFGDKATLFGEACQQFFTPFREQLKESLLHLEADKRLPEIFSVYDRFVGQNTAAIQAFVRFVMESPELRAALQPMLLELHEQFRQDVKITLEELLPKGYDADALATGLVALLDGNLILGLVDPDPNGLERRGAALRALAALLPLTKMEK
jgi:TetR/AcrR family acrAB operon transcriptional repressor